MMSLSLANIHITIQHTTILHKFGTNWAGFKLQKEEKISDEGMDRKTKPTDKVNFIKPHFVSIGVTDPIVTIRNPNFYRRREFEFIPDPLLILLLKRTTYSPSLMWGRRRSDFKDTTILG